MVNKAKRAGLDSWAGYTEEEASGLYELHKRLRDERSKLPLIKLHALGPLSHMQYTRPPAPVDQQSGITFEPDSPQRALQACLKQIEWQVKFLEDRAEQFLCVLDDPGLDIWPRLSEQQRGDILTAYSYLYVRIAELGGFLGLHSCTFFHHDLLRLPAELLSFDLVRRGVPEVFSEGTLPLWLDVLARGVVLAPGIAPGVNTEKPKTELMQAGARWSAIQELFAGKPQVLNRQFLMSANCGHVTAQPAWIKALYDDFSPQ
jgi:hypothetical protein